MTECCPHCRQPIVVRPKRVCYDCGVPMRNHHRWTLQPRGPDGIMTPVHRHCAHPSMTILPSEYRTAYGDEVADRMGVPACD